MLTTVRAVFSDMKKLMIIAAALIINAAHAFCCTSLIISGRVTADGRPVMMKHRDAGELNNRFEWFQGPVYSFIALMNAPSEGGEAWSGTNSSGFCIMNTASYNIKDDDVPASAMDREGEVMFRALGMCATLADFELFLDSLDRPMGVEANFGVIDAQGGAAYYEVNNHSWIKYDVNEIPEGYRVVTNFSESGRVEDYKGYERYLTASAIMRDIYEASHGDKLNISHTDLFWKFSRSYRSEMLGLDFLADYKSMTSEYGFRGIVVDQDFIPRKSTAASVVFEGVAKGGDPRKTVMWGILGYPACSVAVPMMVADTDIIPFYMKRTEDSCNAPICDRALALKSSEVFRFDISNGGSYLDLNNVIKMLDVCYRLESEMDKQWSKIYGEWCDGSISYDSFINEYKILTESYYSDYLQSSF